MGMTVEEHGALETSLVEGYMFRWVDAAWTNTGKAGSGPMMNSVYGDWILYWKY